MLRSFAHTARAEVSPEGAPEQERAANWIKSPWRISGAPSNTRIAFHIRPAADSSSNGKCQSSRTRSGAAVSKGTRNPRPGHPERIPWFEEAMISRSSARACASGSQREYQLGIT